MAWTDGVVNDEDVLFHLVLAVVMPRLVDRHAARPGPPGQPPPITRSRSPERGGSGAVGASNPPRWCGGGSTNTGPVQLLGGTGVYAGLAGHGVDTGQASGNTASGLIEGFLVTG